MPPVQNSLKTGKGKKYRRSHSLYASSSSSDCNSSCSNANVTRLTNIFGGANINNNMNQVSNHNNINKNHIDNNNRVSASTNLSLHLFQFDEEEEYAIQRAA